MRWNGRGMDREDAERKTGKKHHFLGVLRRPSLPPGTQPFGKYGQKLAASVSAGGSRAEGEKGKRKGGAMHIIPKAGIPSLSFNPFPLFIIAFYIPGISISVWSGRKEGGGGGSTSSFLSCLPAPRMQKDSTFRQLISHFCIVFEKGGGREGRSRRRGGGRSSQTRDFCIV